MNIAMKNYQSKLSIFTLAVLTSLGAQAGSVTSTFNTGDTLTATQMNEIKNAVNDNDTRVTTNTQSIANLFGGDGSAGPLIISADTNWNTSPPANFNFNFTTCTIDAGFTLIVPAGTTIRCSGNFINNGTIAVAVGVTGASPTTWGSGASAEIYGIGHPGDTLKAASGGSYDNDGTTTANTLRAGLGGDGIPKATAATSFNKFKFGGGSGGGYSGSGNGRAGGLLRIYSGESITNTANITANASFPCCGSGGGGGGIIILAAINSITNTGTIEANGAKGADSYSFGGAGGGGGGGIVMLVSPTTDNTAGIVNVTGAFTTNITSATRVGGGGGGASGGNGGDGGSVSGAVTGIPATAQDGLDGYLLEINANPLYLN